MDKIAFLGAGSTVFAKNVLGDCMLTGPLQEFEYALYDIDMQRLEESWQMLSNINRNSNCLLYTSIRDHVKIMVGGAPVTEAFCEQIGADKYTADAASAADAAVEICRSLAG